MAVKMRLMRLGKTKSPHYRVVVIDGRAPRDGRYIDLIGRYDPRQDPSLIEIDAEKAVEWLRKGAQPTEAVSKILDVAGALTQFKVRSGRIHTVGASAKVEAAPEPEEAPADTEVAAEEMAVDTDSADDDVATEEVSETGAESADEEKSDAGSEEE